MKFHLSFKKSIIILVILMVVGTTGVVLAAKKKNSVTYTVTPVVKGAIRQTVSETGTVKAVHEINLSFLNSGKIASIIPGVGDHVKAGDLLAELDASSLIYAKNEAEANLDVARSSLNKLMVGASAEDIAVAGAVVNQSQTAYNSSQSEYTKTKKTVDENIAQAQKNLSDLELKTDKDITTYESAITSAQTKLDSAKVTYEAAIKNNKSTSLIIVEDKLSVANTALDIYDRTVNDEDGKDNISVKNTQYLTAANLNYTENIAWQTLAAQSLAAAKNQNTTDSLLKSGTETLNLLGNVFTMLKNCYSALENSVISSSFTQAELDGLKSGISVQQTLVSTGVTSVQNAKYNLENAILAYDTNVSTAEDNLASAQAAYDNALMAYRNALSSARVAGDQQQTLAQSKVSSARESLNLAQVQLNKILSAADKYDLELAKARVRQAEASLSSVNKQIENSRITAETDGTVTKVNYVAGEQIMTGSPVISLLGENNFEIELLISEADISKVRVNDKTEITLDAYGDDLEFSGEVIFIEPAETVIQDVIYYKVKIRFDPQAVEVKSGMTANVVITTAEKDDVLIVPSRAIIEKNGQGKFIQVLVNNFPVEKPVTIGLRGDDGLAEVLTGLGESEQVITYTKLK